MDALDAEGRFLGGDADLASCSLVAGKLTSLALGVGGIARAEDVIEYMMAGASAVQVGYASFRNPTAMIAMIDGIEKWCEAHGVAKVSELTGSMIDHPPRDTYEAGMMGIS